MMMKTMTCRQLGGACDQEFHAGSFEEIAKISRKHGIEMYQKGDEAHRTAMKAMQELMKSSEAMARWMDSKKREFDQQPEM
jgi:hypothetical protein